MPGPPEQSSAPVLQSCNGLDQHSSHEYSALAIVCVPLSASTQQDNEDLPWPGGSVLWCFRRSASGELQTLAMHLIFRVIELPHLYGSFIEVVEQACIDTHPAEILTERLPVGAAAAGRTVMYADHSIPSDTGGRLA
jgi:hypothetical protein